MLNNNIGESSLVNLEITGLYAGLLGLLFIVLSINIVRLRLKYKVGIGDGDNKVLATKIRIHGNFSEYIPFTLILLASYELNGGAEFMLHLCGASIFVGRVTHAIGLSKTIGSSIYRQIGMLTVFISIVILALENIRLFLV